MRESILPRMYTETQDVILGGLLTHAEEKKMAILLGETGEGKTITALDFCALYPKKAYYFCCSPNTTMGSLLRFIANAIGARPVGNNDDLQIYLQSRLKYTTDCCFVFDEVEYLAYGNGNKIDVLRQIFDASDIPIIFCGTYVLKDLISGIKHKKVQVTHNRPQIFRRLRKEEFDIVKEKEVFNYLNLLEKEYNVLFENKVKAELVAACRDRQSGGMGNFIEIIELLFSIIRPEWKDISYQIIKRDGRILHDHFEEFQCYMPISSEYLKFEKENDQQFKVETNTVQTPSIDVSSLETKIITSSLLKDALKHKMTM